MKNMIWCWLRQKWEIILFSGLTVLVIQGIIWVIRTLPKILRIKKVKKSIQGKIDKYVQEFNSLTPQEQKVTTKGLDLNRWHLASEFNETQDIVNQALEKLLRKKIIKIDFNGSYYYEIVMNK